MRGGKRKKEREEKEEGKEAERKERQKRKEIPYREAEEIGVVIHDISALPARTCLR